MKPIDPNKNLNHLAKRYIWWESPTWAYQHPLQFLANVMDLGTWEDILILRKEIGDNTLRIVLKNAPPGYFHQRSWDFWHLKLNQRPAPPLPKRNLT